MMAGRGEREERGGENKAVGNDDKLRGSECSRESEERERGTGNCEREKAMNEEEREHGEGKEEKTVEWGRVGGEEEGEKRVRKGSRSGWGENGYRIGNRNLLHQDMRPPHEVSIIFHSDSFFSKKLILYDRTLVPTSRCAIT